MHILGFILVISGLLVVTYFSGSKNTPQQDSLSLSPQGQVVALPVNSPAPSNTESLAKQQPKNVKSTDKSLKLAAYVFLSSNEKQRNDLISKFSDGTNDPKEAIKKLALLLDNNPEAMAIVDKTVAQDIANKKSQEESKTILDYNTKEYERLKAEVDSLPSTTSYTYTGGTKNTVNTPTKTEPTSIVNTTKDSTHEINNRLKNILNSDRLGNTNNYNDEGTFDTYPDPTKTPEINVYGNADSYTIFGNTVYGSDGSNYTQYGNTVYGNDGSNYTKYGNTIYGSDGSTSTKYGNTTYGNDGTSYTQYGNTTYGNDGSSYTQYGNTRYTQPGY